MEEMKRIKREVDTIILDRIVPDVDGREEIKLLYRMMRDYPQRPAKGIRPFLCIATCKALGGDEKEALLSASCIELFQHWVLIHDDIEDQSELRRGMPTLHRKYNVALALNAGDALHAKMWGALLENREILGESLSLSIMKEFANMVNKTTEGQHMELSWIAENRWDIKEEDYIEMCTRKTSWYTAVGPCRIGALIAGVSEQTLSQLEIMGVKLGIGFQIQDDTLNLTADQSLYGKESSDDILEGKRTLIMIRLLNKAEKQDREKILGIMSKGREEKTEEDIAFILNAIAKYHAIDYARDVARKMVYDALQIMEKINWKGNKEYAEMLKSLSIFMVERKW
jgi:geranylgeranyl diphosphate synthase type II